MSTELEFIDALDKELETVFEEALAARDRAQAALEQIQRIRRERLTQRCIEIQKAKLAEHAADTQPAKRKERGK